MSEWQSTATSFYQGVGVVESVLKEPAQRIYRVILDNVVETSTINPREAKERLAARLQRIAQELLR